MLRAVIFDMDGTLLDSEVIHYIVINDILKRELGWEQTQEEYLKYCGIPDQKMWPMMMDEMDSGNVMSLARKWGMASDEVLPSVEDSGAKPQGNIGEESRRHGLSGQDSSGQGCFEQGSSEQDRSGEGCSEQDGSGQGCFERGSSEQDRSGQGKDSSGQGCFEQGSSEQDRLGEDRSGQSSSRSEQGRSGREVPEQVKSALSAELERLHWAEYDLYIEKNGVKAFPGVRELMGALRTENIRIAVATGSLVRIVRENLKLLGIEEFVEEIATSEDCDNGKPAPDVFLLAAKKLGIAPADCLVVEDAGNGLQGALSAGMACAGFDGSELPSELSLAPIVFSDYRRVKPADMREWHRQQKGSDGGLE